MIDSTWHQLRILYQKLKVKQISKYAHVHTIQIGLINNMVPAWVFSQLLSLWKFLQQCFLHFLDILIVSVVIAVFFLYSSVLILHWISSSQAVFLFPSDVYSLSHCLFCNTYSNTTKRGYFSGWGKDWNQKKIHYKLQKYPHISWLTWSYSSLYSEIVYLA